MMLKEDILKNKYVYIIYCCIIGCIFACFLIKNLSPVPTLMELPDEGGYLWNAAYMLGKDWDDLGKSMFYGYGYSIFLIPAFFFTKTGVSLITAAHITNIVFMTGIYIVFCLILKELFERNTGWIPVIAVIASIMPFLITSTYKVLCEVCFTFFYALLVLFFIYGIKRNKFVFYTLAVLCAAFLPFIHTRGIVITVLFLLFLLADIIKRKKIALKSISVLAIIFGVTFLFLYLVKKDNLNFRSSLRITAGQADNTANLITSKFIIVRLQNIVQKGIGNYIGSFISKFFYSICSMCGVFILIIPFVKEYLMQIFFNKKVDESVYAKGYITCFVFFNFIVTLAACVVNNIGFDIANVYYGRYYEHVLPMLLLVSLYLFIEKGHTISFKYYFIVACIIIFAGLLSRGWIYSYLDSSAIFNRVDTARLAVFSKAISVNKSMENTILYLILLSIIIFIVFIITSRKKILKIFPLLLLGIYLVNIDISCIDKIKESTIGVSADMRIVDYINSELYKNSRIYFFDDDSYPWEMFQRMQILIRDKRLYVISAEQGSDWNVENINDGDFVITYSASPHHLDDEKEYNKIMESKTFILYQNDSKLR